MRTQDLAKRSAIPSSCLAGPVFYLSLVGRRGWHALPPSPPRPTARDHGLGLLEHQHRLLSRDSFRVLHSAYLVHLPSEAALATSSRARPASSMFTPTNATDGRSRATASRASRAAGQLVHLVVQKSFSPRRGSWSCRHEGRYFVHLAAGRRGGRVGRREDGERSDEWFMIKYVS